MSSVGQSYIASGVWSENADVERLETYEDKIHYYQGENYTYIPMPADGKYYDVIEGRIQNIKHEQYIYEDTLMRDVFNRLQRHPFLLVNGAHKNKFYIVDDELKGIYSVRGGYSWRPNYAATDSDEELPEVEDVPGEYFYRGYELYDDFPHFADKVFYKDYWETFNIITVADLNRRYAKDSIYPAIAELAQRLSDLVQSYYPNSGDLVPLLSPRTVGIWYQEKCEGLELHISEYMNLRELKQAIKQSNNNEFIQKCGFPSKTQIDKQLGGIEDLRNKVMHANRTLVHGREGISNTLERIDRIEAILDRIE